MKCRPRVTRHAVDRFRDRVEPSATPARAFAAIRQISSSARACSRPRKWCRLRGVNARPGSRYMYSAAHPGICLVVRGGAIVTVFSKEACADWRKLLMKLAS